MKKVAGTFPGKVPATFRVLFAALVFVGAPQLTFAQLAALEITDGVDNARMLQMLENVRNSVNRTAEVLDHLIWHATRVEKGD